MSSDDLQPAVEVWQQELANWRFWYDPEAEAFQAAPPGEPTNPVVSAPDLGEVIRLAKMRDLFPGMK